MYMCVEIRGEEIKDDSSEAINLFVRQESFIGLKSAEEASLPGQGTPFLSPSLVLGLYVNTTISGFCWLLKSNSGYNACKASDLPTELSLQLLWQHLSHHQVTTHATPLENRLEVYTISSTMSVKNVCACT